MINRQSLLSDLQKFLQRIEADLLERSESTEVPEVPAALHAEYEKAARAERTAQNYEDWRTDTITQAAAAWVLSCVFVRFLEDNSLIDPPKIAGPGDRLACARDEHELYFRSHPKQTDREYLLSLFNELAKMPGTRDIFGEHNAINDLPNWLSGDAAGELLNFFQKIDASTGDLVHDFTDSNWDTRFLGDLYQDLSEAARKKFALLQTPDFVEEFILDRTLDPAIEEFGLVPQASASDPQSPVCFKMIDPACGSGHFLLGAFPRLLDRWQRKEPGTNIRELTQRALNSIHGVDINPFAVAIAKFRLLLVAMKACSIQRLADAPGFRIHVACGDSLLHGQNRTSSGQNLMDFADGATDEELYSHAYPGEDLQTVRELLKPGIYHCVVANPPYIIPNDPLISRWYRQRFDCCHRQYSLAAPFIQQIIQLATEKGYTGQITSNAFMKREFGKKLIENFLCKKDLTHVVDTSGAYIPGHGTPTVVLLIRNRPPVSTSVRTVMGIQSEPVVPSIARNGVVWNAILSTMEYPNTSGLYVSCSDTPRSRLATHPWSISGGGTSDLRSQLEENATCSLDDRCSDIGRTAHTGEDDAFYVSKSMVRNRGISSYALPLVLGEDVRDYSINENLSIVFPYDEQGLVIDLPLPKPLVEHFWPLRTSLKNRRDFGKTVEQRGLRWFEHSMFFAQRFKSKNGIAYSNVSTNNDFAFNNVSRLFNSHAPVIFIHSGASDGDYLEILSALASSTGCFWIHQVFHNKGRPGAESAGADESWEHRYEIDSTKLRKFPLPPKLSHILSGEINKCIDRLKDLSPTGTVANWREEKSLRQLLHSNRFEYLQLLQRVVFLQEELDWTLYQAFGLSEANVYSNTEWSIKLGQRAFEIVLARKIATGEAKSAWFDRHGSTPISELPSDWPDDYKKLIERRIKLIENDPNIRLIEQPEYKRRWNFKTWESQLERSLREWLLLRLETYFDFDGRMTGEGDASNKPASNSVPLGEIAMYSVARLADAARRDPQFMEVGELYRDDSAFDVQALVEELVLAESVPHLPILRYKDSGLRKRAEWEKTWDLQRREDAGESVGTIPVPPKYTSADFISTGGARYWSLRGKLDVPKERWISFPHCEGPDGTLVICWAGYDHLQQAQAISAYYVRVQTEFGGSDDPRLIPLLASLIELLPWLKQWHNEPNANFDGLRMGDYFESFVNEEARNLGKTLAEIKAWVPPKKVAKTTAPKRSSKKVKSVEVDE
jgi:hypothetical protein